MIPATERDFTGYILPSGDMIGRNRHTEKLYKLEDKRGGALRLAALELGRVLQHPEDAYWKHTLPAALLATLESYQVESAIVAAVAFLRRNGVLVDTATLPNFPVDAEEETDE